MATKKNFGKTNNPALAFLGDLEEKKENTTITKEDTNNIDYEKKIQELERKLAETQTAAETKSRNEIANRIFKKYIDEYNR
jgi:hypothetical protein